MASATAPGTPTKYDAELDRELARAAGRIRFNDVLTGGLALAVLTLAFATAAILLDRWLVLPDWARQLNLAAFLLAFALLAYRVLVRPMRRAVNPRFAARRVESTVADAKNAVINWVDLRDREMPDAVRAAVGARAVEEVSEADVHKAVESRRMVWLGVAAGLLVALLAGLFLYLKPNPFLSHVGRTFNPFAAIRIASRTELTLVTPAGGDATVTAGDPVTFVVHVRGSVPDADGPDRVRLLVRHNPAATAYEEIPLEEGGSSREWGLVLPQSVVQTGFWYRVAAGDALTPEHRIDVRSRPLVREFAVRYDYPDYLRMKPETTRDPNLRAYRGTTVTLEARANRAVKRGWMQIDGRGDLTPAEVVGDDHDTLRFRFTVTENGAYRLGFTTADDEPSEPTAGYPIRVVADLPPRVEITSPEPLEITLPVNGLLKVDGTVGDDIGIEGVTLHLQVEAPVRNLTVDLQPKPYRAGESLRRAEDGTFPTSLEYKDSVPLAGVKDRNGAPFVLEENTTLVYWLEATDNCGVHQTSPPGKSPRNVGRSVKKRVKLGPPEKAPEQVQQAQADQKQRSADEAQHRRQQDEQLKTEQRKPPAPLHPEEPVGPKEPPPPGGDQAADAAKGDGAEERKDPGTTAKEPGAKEAAAPSTAEKKSGTGPKEPGSKDPAPPTAAPTKPDAAQAEPAPKAGTDPKAEKAPGAATPPDAKQPETPPPPRSEGQPDPSEVEKQAEKVKGALEQQAREPGAARGQDDARQQPAEPPADAKPRQPPPDAAQAETKTAQPMDGAAESRPDPKDQPKGDGSGPPPAGGQPEKKGEKAGAGDQRGGERPPATPKGEPESRAASGRGDQPVDPAAAKPMQKEGTPPDSAAKPDPAPKDPAKPEQSAASGRSDGATPPPGAPPMPQTASGAEKGTERPSQPQPDPRAGGPGKPDPKDLKRDLDDLASDDPNRQQEARDRLDQSVGKEARQRAEKVAEGMKSKDPARRNQAEDEARELARELGERGDQNSSPPTKADRDVERLVRERADDLASDDPQRREQAEKGFDDLLGKKERDRLQQAARDAKSGDPKKQEQAKKDVDELSKKASKAARGEQEKPTKEQLDELAKKADDLTSDDAGTRQAAEREFDRTVGKERREQLQKDLKDLKSDDQATREAAQQRMQKAVDQARKDAGVKEPSPEEMKKLAEKAQDLDSNDPKKKADAEKALDQAIGEQNRKQLQQDLKDLKSDDKTTREAAQKRLEKAVEQAQKQAGSGKPSAEEMQKLAEKARDLNSPDPQKKAEAEKALDQAVGKETREQIQKELASGDKDRQAAAEKRMQEALEKGGQEKTAGKPPSKEEIEKLAQKAKDLASNDPETRKKAEQEFDQKLGQKGREDLQKNVQDLMSGDRERQKAALGRVREEMAKQAADQPQRAPTEEELQEWKKNARDLTSPDEKTRAEAEQKFDNALGKEEREKLQQQLQEKKDLLGRGELSDRAAEMAAQKQPDPNQSLADRLPKEWRPKGAGGGMEGKPFEDDPRNRLKRAEMQLKTFKENVDNEQLRNRLGWTEEQMKRFAEEYEKRVAQLRNEVERTDAAAADDGKKPKGPATLNVGGGSEGKKFTPRADGTAGGAGAAGPGTAPPGYSDAQRKFAEEAARRKKGAPTK